ncbi:hypothetical protein PSACC_00613 [Paramicrosporidium saccamoebae]|uniref:Uncharacterized protein n=1 Tax=Paramicrosporidium saccamoebae TaxID=1246581 RepID=A0A2H9TPA3_9FUNG|nr:hypothetical protein PSACC_00613 [Paramicrosporidium saccamoebae]
MRIVVLVLLGLAVSFTEQQKSPTEDRKQVLWIDYVSGLYTTANAWALVLHAKNEMQRRIGSHSNSRVDKLLSRVVETINERIPETARATYDKIDLSGDRSWLGVNCAKNELLCDSLEDVRKKLETGNVLDAYALLPALRRIKGAGKHPITDQLVFAASMAVYDLTTPEACVPIWPRTATLSVKEMIQVVEGTLAILNRINQPKSTKEACKLLGRREDDPVCIYALVTVGFEPVEKNIETIKDHEAKEELGLCMRGRRDPCAVLKDSPKFQHAEELQKSFKDQCKWRRGVEAIADNCPDPNATLPLHRAVLKSDMEKDQKSAIAAAEKWFWIHTYSQQCKRATRQLETLNAMIEMPKGATAFALERMDHANSACKEVRFRGLETVERKMGILERLANGEYDGAVDDLAQSNIDQNLRDYYTLVILMLENPRMLELSELLSKPILYPNQWRESLLMMQRLEAVKEDGPHIIPEHEDPELVGLLLVLSGHGEDALRRLERPTLKSGDPFMAELMAVARICVATTQSLCTPTMSRLLDSALSQVHLAKRRDFYYDILGQLCEMTQRRGSVSDGTALFKMTATWADLFGHRDVGVYKFANDVGEQPDFIPFIDQEIEKDREFDNYLEEAESYSTDGNNEAYSTGDNDETYSTDGNDDAYSTGDNDEAAFYGSDKAKSFNTNDESYSTNDEPYSTNNDERYSGINDEQYSTSDESVVSPRHNIRHKNDRH